MLYVAMILALAAGAGFFGWWALAVSVALLFVAAVMKNAPASGRYDEVESAEFRARDRGVLSMFLGTLVPAAVLFGMGKIIDWIF